MTVCHVPVLCADHAEKAFGGAKKKGFWIQTFGFFDQFWDVIIFLEYVFYGVMVLIV